MRSQAICGLLRLAFFAEIITLLSLAAAEQECSSSSKILLQASTPKARRTSAPKEELAETSAVIEDLGNEGLGAAGKLLEEAVMVQARSGSGAAILDAMEAVSSVSKSGSRLWHSYKHRQKDAPKDANLLSGDLEGEKVAERASATYSLFMVGLGLVLGVMIYVLLQNREAILKLMQILNLVPADKGQATQATTSEAGKVQQVPLTPLEDLYFCPDLVVPAGCECILLVPSRLRGSESHNITDSNGSTVLSVVTSSEGPSAQRTLVAGNNVTLASCGRSRSSLPGSMLTSIEFELISASGDVWARINYEPRQGAEDRCTITTKTEQQLHMVGSVRYNALNMTDDQGGLLATTEPVVEPGPLGEAPGSVCRLRVAPMADVGLVLCSLICLKHLSSDA